jgi:hypothetical protein
MHKVRSGENCRYLFLTFQTSQQVREGHSHRSGYPLQFVKELNSFEFETMEDDLQYFVCRISCKLLETFSLHYSTKAEDYREEYPNFKGVSHPVQFA